MVHAAYQSRPSAAAYWNKTGTELLPAPATVNENGTGPDKDARRRCSFVAAERWRYGGDEPFCNAPAVAGSAYCARHLARCAGTAASAEAELAGAAEAPPPPPELGFLAEAALPEPLPEEEGELRVLLDVQPAARDREE